MAKPASANRPQPAETLPAVVVETPPAILPGELAPPPFWCSWETKSPEGKKLLVQCLSGVQLQGSELLDKELPIANVCFVAGESTDDVSGEIETYVRTVLVLENGSLISFGSSLVAKHLGWIMSPNLYGKPPWNPPLKVVVSAFRTGNKRTAYRVDVA